MARPRLPRPRLPARRRAGTKAPAAPRYTIDASVFVNAFNTFEVGHAESLELLTAVQASADPVIVPSLLLVEVASALARSTNDEAGALRYARAIAGLEHVTIVPLNAAAADAAAGLAAVHRLRGADAVYAAVASRHGTALVSRDDEQRKRANGVVACVTPGEALRQRRPVGHRRASTP